MTPLVMLAIIATAAFLVAALPVVLVWHYGRKHTHRNADAAVVLGASICGGEPSPVFRERINHGIALWRGGTVRYVLLTGGLAERWGRAESEIARDYAIRQGVPPEVLLVETKSRSTLENMIHARRVMRHNRLRTALIVSDPGHLRRAMAMARDQGIRAWPSPTPTSRFVSPRKKLRFLIREGYGLLRYRIVGY